ncbi:homoserine dehydrogenase [Paracoccaceae bacterium]|nr:homoserine dehydrogenase [Paracoccaceae bacterium]
MGSALKIGIAGLGTVGAGVVKILHSHSRLITSRSGKLVELKAISARSRSKDRGVSLEGLSWESDIIELAGRSDIDVFVELIGGDGNPAKEAIETALKSGKHVITANKALLAKHGQELAKLAEKNNVSLKFEAAVAGGIPAVKVLTESLVGNKINRIMGVMNGTCNYILTRMETSNLPYETVFNEAQKLGYLEADPTLDTGGIDAGHKLAILSSIAFGTQIDFKAVVTQGIELVSIQDIEQAREMGYRIKLLGVSQMTDEGLEQRMQPCLVSANSPIGQLENAMNMIIFDGDHSGQIILRGAGAGEGPTSSAVMSDIIDIARGNKIPTFGQSANSLIKMKPVLTSTPAAYYIRTKLEDSPGVLAKMATALGNNGISIDQMRQTQHADVAAPVVIVTHKTLPETLNKALIEIMKTDVTLEAPVALRIEDV